MKCLYCDFETHELDNDDCADEIDKHILDKHPEHLAMDGTVFVLLRNKYEFKVSLDEIVKDYFDLRDKLGKETKRREQLKNKTMEWK